MTGHRFLSDAKGRKRLSIQHLPDHLYHIRQISDMAIYPWLMDTDGSMIEVPRSKLRGIFDRKEVCLFFDSLAVAVQPSNN